MVTECLNSCSAGDQSWLGYMRRGFTEVPVNSGIHGTHKHIYGRFYGDETKDTVHCVTKTA